MSCSPWCSVTCVDYLLDHDAVHAHVFVAPGEVEHVHPAESKAQHQEVEVLLLPEQIQAGRDQEEDALRKTTNSREASVSLLSLVIIHYNNANVHNPSQIL